MSLQFFIGSLPHLVPYLLLLLAYLVISFNSELLENRIFAAPILILLTVFVGLRGIMTPDMERYSWIYQHPNGADADALEPSFYVLSHVLHALGLDYHALFFCYTLITFVFVYLGIRNQTPHVKLALLLYVLLPGYFLNLFVEMREMSAVAIVFYALTVFRRKGMKMRLPIFSGLAALSVAFHFSAILFWLIVLPAWKFIRKPHAPWLYLSMIVGSLLVPTSFLINLISLAAMPILPGKYHGYVDMFLQLETGLTESGQLLKTLIYAGLAVCFIFWWRRKEGEERDFVPLNLFVIGVVLLGLTRSFAAASRISYFFVIYQIILFPAMLERVKDRVIRLLTAYGTVLFYFAQFTYGLFFYSVEAGNYPYLHYQNVLFSVFGR